MIWDVAVRCEVRPFDLNGAAFFQFAFSPDGRSLAGRSSGGLDVRRLDDGNVKMLLVRSIRLRCLGMVSVVADVGRSGHRTPRLHLLETTRWAELGCWNLPCKDISTVAFAPDGRTLALGGPERPNCSGGTSSSSASSWGCIAGRRQDLILLRVLPRRPKPGGGHSGRAGLLDGMPRPPLCFQRSGPIRPRAPRRAPAGRQHPGGGRPPGGESFCLDAATLQVRARLGEGLYIGQMAFLPGKAGSGSPVLLDGRRGDAALALWDASHGKLLHQLPGRERAAACGVWPCPRTGRRQHRARRPAESRCGT